ncbi:hypothetical protein LCGC14_0856040 [marine sediment metagenome]|uniref:Uncharacterized protein n=1 Tax=marine sediment metagenome TaxID=412755 RepID=A0A0F9PU76_9ZZZZ
MSRKANWTFEGFYVKLDELEDSIKNKALDIAAGFMETGKYTERDAIEEAIVRAEEWFYDLEG